MVGPTLMEDMIPTFLSSAPLTKLSYVSPSGEKTEATQIKYFEFHYQQLGLLHPPCGWW